MKPAESGDCLACQEIIEGRALGVARDGEQDEFVARHVRGCEVCRALAGGLDLLATIPPVTASDVERYTLRGLAALKEPAKPRRFWLVPIGALAGALAMSLVLMQPWRPRPQHLTVVAGQLSSSGEAATEVRELREVLAGTGGALVHADDRTVLALRAGAHAKLAGTEDGVQAQLVGGLLAADVPATSRASIVTAAGDISGTGMLVAVQVEGGSTRVDVVRGDAVVTATSGSITHVMTAQSLVLGASYVTVLEPSRQQFIFELVAGKLTVVEETAAPAPTPIAETEHAVVPEHASLHGAPTEPEADPVDTLLLRASACLTRKDWACAARAYRVLIAKHGDHLEALTAMVTLAGIELHQLDDPQAALRHYDTYLSRRPDGSLEPDALFGKAECLRALHREVDERSVLQVLQERHPMTVYAERARQRLRELTP